MIWIALTSLVLNAFTLFVFQLNKNDNNQEYCDINKKFKYEYFVFNSIYMLFVSLVPSIIITVCNSFIIHRTFQNKLKRKKLFENDTQFTQFELNDQRKNKIIRKNSFKLNYNHSNESSTRKIRLKPYYYTYEQSMRRKCSKTKRSSKIFRMNYTLYFLNLISNNFS